MKYSMGHTPDERVQEEDPVTQNELKTEIDGCFYVFFFISRCPWHWNCKFYAIVFVGFVFQLQLDDVLAFFCASTCFLVHISA